VNLFTISHRPVALILALGLCTALVASERSIADALAVAGASLVAKGNAEQGKEMLYKALANDENCPDALFELARLFEKEGNAHTACDFYQRAALVYAQENAPSTIAKRNEAERRIKALNPFAPRLNALFEDYALDLDRLVKKTPDSLTIDAAAGRVSELKLAALLAPEKMPKFIAAAQKASASPPTSTLPDVERELKALGWATVSGVWVKKAPGVYEAIDGKLEAAKANGSIDLFVLKGGSGSVKACVRNGFNDPKFMDLTLSGYGVLFKGRECRVYGPNDMVMKYFNGSLDPALIATHPLPESLPKYRATVSVTNEGALEFTVNDKRKSISNNKQLPKAGGFIIEVTGTMTLENPRCAGQ